eukprot:PhM_4_TR9769/c4_g1_i2/m.46162
MTSDPSETPPPNLPASPEPAEGKQDAHRSVLMPPPGLSPIDAEAPKNEADETEKEPEEVSVAEVGAVATTTGGRPARPPHPSALPPIVLKCPECDFMCTSNNQMCRHIFMTYHCLAKCAECDMRLLIWTYCPGVVKMMHRAKKDGLISVVTSIETPEKHASRTHHKGTSGTVWTKEQFQVEGTPSDFGLTALPRCGSMPTYVGQKFQCPVCSRVISTWTQMTKHLDATNHSLARCARCDLPLKCYGTNQPSKHERLTKHRGIVGYFRVKEDYLYIENGAERPGKLFQVACPDCGVSFFHTAFLAQHMISAGHSVEIARETPLPRCNECDHECTVEEMEAHHRAELHHGLKPDIVSVLATTCKQSPNVTEEAVVGKSRERAVPSGTKVMYQCPECVAIFSSWTKMEKHIFYTKHSLPKCAQCGVYLRPRGWNSPEDHTAITGHQGLIGEVKKKFEYEVTVDINDAELLELIDDPNGLPPKMTNEGTDGDAHLVFQCPVETCLHVCLSWVLLEKHFNEEHHGYVNCEQCGEEIAPWRPDAIETHRVQLGHEFVASEENPLKIQLEEYQVTITDQELLTYYGDKFKRCTECGQVLDANMLLAHMGGRRCNKNQERQRQEKLQQQQKHEQQQTQQQHHQQYSGSDTTAGSQQPQDRRHFGNGTSNNPRGGRGGMRNNTYNVNNNQGIMQQQQQNWGQQQQQQQQ